MASKVYRGNVKISKYHTKKLCVHKSIIVEWSKGATNRSVAEHLEVLLQLIKASYIVLKAVFQLFPDNAGSKFTTELPKYLHLPKGEWSIALQEIRILGNLKRQGFYVNCSLYEPDSVYGLPVLRRMWVKGGKKIPNQIRRTLLRPFNKHGF